MNHDSCPTDDPRSVRITGSALVMTRLSSVAMNIGREVATIATQSGTRRAVAEVGARSPATASAGWTTGTGVSRADMGSSCGKKALNDYLRPETISNQVITCQACPREPPPPPPG